MPGTRLTQKVAIVTGGAHGVGRAIVTNFQDEGAHVYTSPGDPGGFRK